MKLPRRILYALAAPAAAAGLAIAASPPAWATGPLCYSFDGMHCAGTADFSIGTAVGVATTGRTIQWVASDNVLKFTGATNRCIRITDSFFAVVGHCSGDLGINFTQQDGTAPGRHYYKNNRASSRTGATYVLGAIDSLGTQLQAVNKGDSPGWEKQWDGP